MDLSRARGVALLLVGVLAAALGLAVGAGSPASASAGAAPSVSYRMAGGESVVVSGRTAKASDRVRIDRRVGSHWSRVTTVRSNHHRYATTVTLTAGTRVPLRVTSSGRSRTVVVPVPAAPTGSAAAPTTTQAAAKPLSDACGVRPRKADGTLWSCTFHDDFDGTALDRTKWVPQTAFMTGDTTAGYACYLDSPNNVSVANGMLNLTVRKEAAPVPCGSTSTGVTAPYSAGSISTYHLFSQQYGRFEARIRNTASSAPGLHEAFWLWPDDRVASTVSWPDAGEIDVSETYSNYNNLSIPYLHYSQDANGPQPGLNTAWNCTAYRGTWNTYTLEWTPTTITILVNGTTCLVNTSGDPAFQKPYIVNLTQALGEATNAMTADTPIPATMNVDYVRVWK